MKKIKIIDKKHLRDIILHLNEESEDFKKFNSKYSYGHIKDFSRLFYDCGTLNAVPNLNTSKVKNMERMFHGCNSLRYINLFNTSNVENMKSMFNRCSSLVSIPLFDTSNVENMDGMFYGCSSLISIPLFNTSNVKDISSMFSECSSLVSIPLFDTSNVKNMAGMFYGCSSLVSIPLFNTSNVKYMSRMFSECSSLVSIPLFDTSNVENMDGMFKSCISLENIPSFNSKKLQSCSEIFYNCKLLEKIPDINMPIHIKSYNKINMFYGCNNLKNNPELEYNESELISEEDFEFLKEKYYESDEDDTTYCIHKKFSRDDLNNAFIRFIQWKQKFGVKEAFQRSYDDCTYIFNNIFFYKQTLFENFGITFGKLWRSRKKKEVIEIRKKFINGESSLRQLRAEYSYPMFEIKNILTCKYAKYIDAKCISSLENFDLDKKVDDSIKYYFLDNNLASNPRRKIWSNTEIFDIKNDFLSGKSSVYELSLKYIEKDSRGYLVYNIKNMIDESLNEIKKDKDIKNDFFAYLEELSSVYNYYLRGCDEYISRNYTVPEKYLNSTHVLNDLEINNNSYLTEQAEKLYPEFDVITEWVKSGANSSKLEYIIKKNIFDKNTLDKKINFVVNESREFFKHIFINHHRLRNNVSEEELEHILVVLKDLLYIYYFNGEILNFQNTEILETNNEYNEYKNYIHKKLPNHSILNQMGISIEYNSYSTNLLNCNFFRAFGDFISDYSLNGETISGSKGEIMIVDILKNFGFSDDFKREYFVSIEQEYHYFDFLSEKYKVVIEYDGKQHYEPVNLFGGEEAFEKLKRKDEVKNKWCKDNNYKLLRLKYTLTIDELYSEISKLLDSLNINKM